MKSRIMRYTGYVARTGDIRNYYKILVEILKVRDNLEDLDVDGKVILRIYLKGGGVDWINMAQDMYQRQAVLNLQK